MPTIGASMRGWLVRRPYARRDVEGRRALLHIAENYEQLAEQAERVRKTRAAPIEY
jgi:hypothetical protein